MKLHVLQSRVSDEWGVSFVFVVAGGQRGLAEAAGLSVSGREWLGTKV